MNTPLQCLLVEDSADDAELLLRELRTGGFDVTWERVETAAAMRAALDRQPWDLIIADYSMPQFSGLAALEVLNASGLDLPFIMISGTMGEEQVVTAMRAGVHDYFIKGRLAHLIPAVERELHNAAARRAQQRTETALNSSEVRYRGLFEAAKDGILILDAETGLIVDVNPFLIHLLGFSHEVFLGKKIWELGFFKDIVANQDNFAVLQQQEYIRYEDMALETSDGRRIEVEFISNLYLVNQQKVIQCFIRDISHRKRAEAALRASNEKYRGLFESSCDALMTAEPPSWRFTSGNPATVKMFGTKNEGEFISHEPWKLSPERQPDGRESAEKAKEMFETAVREGSCFFEWRHRRIGGEEFPATVLLSRMESAGKVSIQATVRDVTERRRAEEYQARLAMAVEQAAETIVITDTSGTILYVNPAFEKITGYTRAEAYGQNPRVLKSGQHDAEFYRKLWAQLTAGQVWSGHIINKRKNGTLFEEEATISPVLDAAGKIINYVAVKRDVTREVALEEQNRQAAKMEAVGRLAGGVAHDFNNKLQIIMFNLEMLLNEVPAGHEFRAGLLDIQEAAQHSAALTRQLLTFSRKQAIEPVLLDLNTATAVSLKMLGRLVGENIQLQLVAPVAEETVFIDPGQLDQLLANLVVNARDAIPGTGTITIDLTHRTLAETDCRDRTDFVQPGEYVVLTVRDNGVGMAPEIQAHIFEPFFTTKAVGKGTGLGLATVYGIVKQNHGAITVQSAPGQGTTFSIYLPRAAAAVSASVGKIAEPMPTGTETILVVEDEASVLDLIRRTLALQGYKVLAAVTPHLAVRLCQQHPEPIHLLLTDVVMPEMDGHELSEHIQALRPNIRILFMSGYSSEVMEQHGHLPTDLHVLQKPFNAAALAQRVRAALDAPPPMKNK